MHLLSFVFDLDRGNKLRKAMVGTDNLYHRANFPFRTALLHK